MAGKDSKLGNLELLEDPPLVEGRLVGGVTLGAEVLGGWGNLDLLAPLDLSELGAAGSGVLGREGVGLLGSSICSLGLGLGAA